MGNGICENVCFFKRNARNIRNGNAAEIEKEKHFTAISIGLYSLNCLANIFLVLFVESAYNNLHLAEKKSCVTSSTANSVKLVEN